MEFSLKYVSYDKEYLVNGTEAVLFAAGDPVSQEKLAQIFDITKYEVSLVIDALEARLAENNSSFELCRLSDSYQLCSKKEYAEPIQKYLEIKRTAPISKAALEALAIVAYKQPVTKTYIEQVRGVDCTGIVSTLIQRELIEECGRLDAPGRPILYQTTLHFLRCFGLESLEDLPGENSVQLSIDSLDDGNGVE